MKRFSIFLWKILLCGLIFCIGFIFSTIAIASLDPLSDFFIIIPELSSEIAPFFFVHTAVLAKVCIYYTFFHSYGGAIVFLRKYWLFILLAYVTSFILYFVHAWASFSFVLWYGIILIIIINLLYFLWKEIYRKIGESDSYKLSQIQWCKNTVLGFIWSSILQFDLLWFWNSSKPIKQKLTQFLEILLYSIPVSFVLLLPILLIDIDWSLFNLIALKIQLDINGSFISLHDAFLWMYEQQQLWIGWRDEYREIYKWENMIYDFIAIFLFGFAGILAFLLGVILKNRKRRLLSLIFLSWVTVIFGIIIWIYVLYIEAYSYESNKECIEYNHCGKGPNWEYGSEYHPKSN